MAAPIDPVCRELGRLVFNFNAAEHALRRLAFLLIDATDERTGEITADRLGANGLEDLVRALADYKLRANQDRAKQVTDAVTRFGHLRQRRNDYVHALWVIPNESTALEDIAAIKRVFRKGNSFAVGSLDSTPIHELAGEAANQCEDLETLHGVLKNILLAS